MIGFGVVFFQPHQQKRKKRKKKKLSPASMGRMWANSISEPSERVLLASNLPRLSEDSKMLRAGT